MKATGVVTKVFTRTKTKAGKPLRSPAYSVQINDSDWYSFGFSNPNMQEGDTVEFEYENGDFGKEGNANSVKVTGSPAPGTSSKQVTADSRQESIVYQSCLKVAAQVMPDLVAQGAIKLPAKAADKLGVYIDAMEEVAKELAIGAISPDLSVSDTPIIEDE